jgi:hypothetical protein
MIFVFSHQLRTFFFFCSSSCTALLFLLLDNTLVVVSESDGDGLLFAASATDLALAFAVSLDMYIIYPISSSVSISEVLANELLSHTILFSCVMLLTKPDVLLQRRLLSCQRRALSCSSCNRRNFFAVSLELYHASYLLLRIRIVIRC